MKSIIWTGANVDEMIEFVKSGSVTFGFVHGSSRGRERWWHRWFDKMSYPKDDMSILEIYPERPLEGIAKFHKENSRSDLDKLLRKLGEVHDKSPVFNIHKVKEIFAVIEEERDERYIPWNWTTANPGDRIFADGTIERYDG